MRKTRLTAVAVIMVIAVLVLVGCNGTGDPGLDGDKTYTITFETNGGTTIEPMKVSANSEFALPDDPVKERYTFAGWYMDAEFNRPLDMMTVRFVTEDFTLYAKWLDGRHRHKMAVVDQKMPTCTENGYVLNGCSDRECNYMKHEIKAPLGHNFETHQA